MRLALFLNVLVFLLGVTCAAAANCTDTAQGYYCTLYDDDGNYVHDGILPQTIISSRFVPELEGHNLYIYSEGTYYHNGHTGLEFGSLQISGSGHFFIDGHSSVTINGNLTIEAGASLSVGTDSTLHVEGSLNVQPGAILFGVVTTQRPMLTFAMGSPDFTHFTARQNSVTSAPEIFFYRKLCETPAFVLEEGRTNNAMHRLFLCQDETELDDAVVVYDRVPLALQADTAKPISIPSMSQPPTFNNQTGADMYTVGGVVMDPRRVWPYYTIILVMLFCAAGYAVFDLICKKRVKARAENIKILMGGENGYADEYELSTLTAGDMGFTNLLPDFDSSTSSDADQGPSTLGALLDESERLKNERAAALRQSKSQESASSSSGTRTGK